MPKQGTRAEVNTFIQGLITEASPLNFPPNASKEEENFDLFRDGTRKRRLGIDFEEDYFFLNTGITNTAQFNSRAQTAFKWTNVGGITTQEFLVIQLNGTLYFYDMTLTTSVSDSFVGQWGGFGTFLNNECSFAVLEGNLVITFGNSTVGILAYDSGTKLFKQTLVPILTRDLWGCEAITFSQYETDPYYRGPTLNKAQLYNLRNQSWAKPKIVPEGTMDPLKAFVNYYGKYPSNSETVWPAMQFEPVIAGAVPYERIYVQMYDQYTSSAPYSPKGFFIIDALNRGTSRAAEMAKNDMNALPVVNLPLNDVAGTGLLLDQSPDGVSLVAEFAGRAFYAGFGGRVSFGDKRSPILSNYVFFSQLVKSPSDINKCYQEGDPTSREGSDLVDSDGGFLRISGAKKIISLQNMSTHLVVFADNGVWAISGGGEYGFTATNFKVTKVSSFAAASAKSILNFGGTVMYWGTDAIYKLAFDKFNALLVDSVTQTTIQSFYNKIPLVSKEKARCIYDEDRKRVVWMYKEGTAFSNSSVTRELIYDTTLNCFYLNRFATVSDVEPLVPFFHKNIIMYVTLTSPTRIADPGALTFSYLRDKEFKDWKTITGEGVDAKAFLLTGSQIAGDSAVVKQIPYLVMHFRKTEKESDELGVPLNQSGCLFRTHWDWATNTNSNKVGALQQAYKYRKPFFASLPDVTYDNGFETVTSKNKVRGRGRAFALYFETEPGKDCDVLGWNISLNGNALA